MVKVQYLTHRDLLVLVASFDGLGINDLTDSGTISLISERYYGYKET